MNSARFANSRLGETASASLDLMRGLAAIVVMIGHIRALFFTTYGETAGHSLPVSAFYFLTSLGHEAVVVFFVLSGYFISGSVIKSVATDRWAWRDYLIRRWTRLSIVLLPALLLGGALDCAGLAIFGAVGPYTAAGGYQYVMGTAVTEHLSWPIMIANALYLQEIVAPTFGSNGALWSLSYEFWFYLMFPCLLFAILTPKEQWHRLVWAVLLLTIAAFVGLQITGYFLVWLLGAVVVVVPKIRLGRPVWLLALGATGVLSALAIVALKALKLGPLTSDLTLGIVLAAFVYVLVIAPERAEVAGQPALFPRTGSFLASFSYSLYLTHLPALVFLCAASVWSGGAFWQPTVPHVVAAGGLALLMLGYAWGVSRLSEAHTQRVAAFLIAKSKGRKLGAA